ncbi:MAG TPA: hypothetical protein DIS79_03680 [Bacteroidetes bacterium]|nr:hypothetical protein [Bacteroidota bacterium]
MQNRHVQEEDFVCKTIPWPHTSATYNGQYAKLCHSELYPIIFFSMIYFFAFIAVDLRYHTESRW